MEPVNPEMMADRIRLRLIMGKYRVIKVEKNLSGFDVLLQLPGVSVLMQLPPQADVKEGDLLTLYTEVLTNDNPSTASVQ